MLAKITTRYICGECGTVDWQPATIVRSMTETESREKWSDETCADCDKREQFEQAGNS